MRRAGVTIVEVLIVIVMVAAAIGLILPIVLRLRENSAKMETNNKLKECALAVHRYHDEHKKLPHGFGPSEKHGGKNVSVWFQLLPFLGHEKDYVNGVVDARVAAFLAPADISLRGEPGALSFAGNIRVFGYQSVNHENRAANKPGTAVIEYIPKSPQPLISGLRLNTIPDGTTNTIMMATRYANCAGQKTWYAADVFGACELKEMPSPGVGGFMGAGTHNTPPTPVGPITAMFQLAPTVEGCLLDAGVFGHSFRPTGMSVALCDGSVRDVRANGRPPYFAKLLCPGDGGHGFHEGPDDWEWEWP
jgi:hypothetical protein